MTRTQMAATCVRVNTDSNGNYRDDQVLKGNKIQNDNIPMLLTIFYEIECPDVVCRT